MNFTLADAAMLLGAVAATGLLVFFPGYALARMTERARASGQTTGLDGLVVGLATLPAIDSVVTRLGSLDVALALDLLLATVGAILLFRRRHAFAPPRLVAALLVVAWGVLVAFEWVDFDVAGKLYQPLTIFDLVKHAATTQALYDSGAPPRDAFFLRPERSSYYYFFYTVAAVAMRASAGLIDAKAAVGGLVFWVGLGAYGLVRLALAECGIVLKVGPKRQPLLIVAVLAAGGLDIFAVAVFAVTRHYWVADPLQWNEQVAAWFEDVIWVPHHVSGLIAGMVGLFALAGIADARWEHRRTFGHRATAVALAGTCFAAMLGLSVWVTLGFVMTVAVWALYLLGERRWAAIGSVGAAGAVALVLALPQLLDLKAGRAPGGPFPIAVAIRFFTPVDTSVADAARPFADALALPINYAFEFGVIALGSLLFWRLRRSGDADLGGGETMRVLAIAGATGLVAAALLRSTIFNNDLGWRIPLLSLLAGTVWTIAAFDRVIAASPRKILKGFERPAIAVALVCGWATVAYTAMAMRLYPFFEVNPAARFMAADPDTQHGLRSAFEWANKHLPASTVLQQNPMKRRAFAFGVYGRNPTGVADAFGSLYGADPAAVAARRADLGAIFESDLSASDAAARASAAGVSDLVVTASDPVWAQRDSFVWRVKPAYASANVRIIPVQTLEAAR